MQNSFLKAACALTVTAASLTFTVTAQEGPIALGPIEVFDPGAEFGFLYQGQHSKGGRIDLTASNGFFDSNFRAIDEGPGLPNDEAVIRASFGALKANKNTPGTARWHLWCPQPGKMTLKAFFKVSENDAGKTWTITMGDQRQVLVTEANDGGSAQSQRLEFEVKEAGKKTISIDWSESPAHRGTEIRFLRAEGAAIEKARLLRVRWRPAAVHQSYEPAADCPQPGLWVFETKSVLHASSYSPLTTPFGYFGTSFQSDGKVAKGASFNFSMWFASRKHDIAPPAELMPQLLATGLPDAEFSFFSHEGTGVKLRNATAYPEGTDRVIQALRVEFIDKTWHYYGYFYDESKSRWILFAAAKVPLKPKRSGPKPGAGTLPFTGSFCEIPGPPARQRSGDIVREITRRGWFRGSDGKWVPAKVKSRNGTAGAPSLNEMREALQAGDSIKIDSKRMFTLDDQWLGMATGGMELYPLQAPKATALPERIQLPDYLSPERSAQLQTLPIEFAPNPAPITEADRASVVIKLATPKLEGTVKLYYGTSDALCYPARELKGGSEAAKTIFSPERTWQNSTNPKRLIDGVAKFELVELKPGTRYFYRALVESDQGKSWQFESGAFTTQDVR